MRALLSSRVADQLAILGDIVVVADGNELVGIERNGNERWQRTFGRPPGDLTPFANHIAFKQSFSRAASIVIAVDRAGIERWRYDREWFIGSDGLAGDDRGLVVSGGDYAEDGRRWVMLSEQGVVDGTLVAPTYEPAKLAGGWIYASGTDRNDVIRADRDGQHPTTLLAFHHLALAANQEHVIAASETEAVVLELSTGRERFRAAANRTLRIGVMGAHAAWVDAERCPVVYDLSSGRQVWRGGRVEDLADGYYYECHLASSALVCYGRDHVAYYDLRAVEPVRTEELTQIGRFWGDLFLEPTDDGLACWQPT